MKFEDSLPSPSRLLKLANQSFRAFLRFHLSCIRAP